jgi:hypothetical protein
MSAEVTDYNGPEILNAYNNGAVVTVFYMVTKQIGASSPILWEALAKESGAASFYVVGELFNAMFFSADAARAFATKI